MRMKLALMVPVFLLAASPALASFDYNGNQTWNAQFPDPAWEVNCQTLGDYIFVFGGPDGNFYGIQCGDSSYTPLNSGPDAPSGTYHWYILGDASTCCGGSVADAIATYPVLDSGAFTFPYSSGGGGGPSVPAIGTSTAWMPESSQLLGAVVASTQATGSTVWNMLGYMGIPIAFIIAIWVVEFIRHSTKKARGRNKASYFDEEYPTMEQIGDPKFRDAFVEAVEIENKAHPN